MSDAQANPATIKRERGERFDLIVAALTAVATSVSFILAILTPPKGGPFCTAGCVEYPYTDIAAYIPRDFLWMYPALLPAPLFVILLSGVRERAALDRSRSVSRGRVRRNGCDDSHGCVLHPAAICAASRLSGRTRRHGALDPVQPDGVFIALEEAGHLLIGLAFLFAGLALSTDSRVLRAVRTIFFLGFASVVTTFVALSAVYGFQVEYRFEVAVISIDWTVLIAAGALLAIAYGTQSRRSSA